MSEKYFYRHTSGDVCLIIVFTQAAKMAAGNSYGPDP